jgi:hypothetical protein
MTLRKELDLEIGEYNESQTETDMGAVDKGLSLYLSGKIPWTDGLDNLLLQTHRICGGLLLARKDQIAGNMH